jgi:hypothetical protein
MGIRIALVFALIAGAFAGSARADLLDDHLKIDRSALLAQVDPPPPGYPASQPYPTTPAPQPYYQQPPPVYQPAPVYYQPFPQRAVRYEMRPRYGLFAAGLAIFGASWLSDISITYASNHNPAWESLIPLVGPLLQTRDGINTTGPGGAGYNDSDTESVARFFLVWDFIFQLGGATMAILGLVLNHRVAVYADAADDAKPQKTPPKVQMAFTPGPGGHGQGFALVF